MSPGSSPPSTPSADASVPAQRVSFGTSGHRGSAFKTAFNEDHILAITQAICDYRNNKETDQSVTGPLFLAQDTHALSEPAFAAALEVLAANNIETMVDEEPRLHPHTRALARHPHLQPRPPLQPRRRRRHHAIAQPSRRRRLQVQPA